MSIKNYFLLSANAQFWLGQARAYRTAAGWCYLRPQTVESFRSLMRSAAINAVKDAKWARQRAQTEARITAAFGGAK